MKTFLFLAALGTLFVVTQGCGHPRTAKTADSKVVVTIEGESRYVGRVLATLPHRSGASSPPAEESNMSAGRMASDDEALDDEAPDDDSEYDDEDAGSDDDESEERPRCEGRERAEGRGRRRSSWD
jgi:hypothetical protein